MLVITVLAFYNSKVIITELLMAYCIWGDHWTRECHVRTCLGNSSCLGLDRMRMLIESFGKYIVRYVLLKAGSGSSRVGMFLGQGMLSFWNSEGVML